MPKHTSGPWHVGMKPGPMIYGKKGEQLANLTVPMLPDDENAANARLIADAPELLDLLAEAFPFVEEAIDDETNAPNGRARIRKLSRKIRAMIEKHDS